MKRRDFLQLSVVASASLVVSQSLTSGPAFAADPKAKPLTAKDILQEGAPATIANYCEKPEKQPNKFCPTWKDKPGHCETCTFFNTDNSLADFKGGKYAHCQLLTDATKPQFVNAKAWCATYNPKPKV